MTKTLQFEFFVADYFSDFELSAVTQTLTWANLIVGREVFTWRFVSQTSGLIKSASGMMVRSDPAVDGFGFSDVMIVVGGPQVNANTWLRRARAMQRQARSVVLLSDAATAYIQATRQPAGRVTTHWRDVAMLNETNFIQNMSGALSENSNGIITAAGAGSTCELILGIIAPLLDRIQIAELGNRLLLPTIRKSDAAQPASIADNKTLFDAQVTQALQVMAENIAEPLTMSELVREIGLSTRHVERIFKRAFNETPARFYKQLRAKRAYALVEETVLPLIEVAMATGFHSSSAMSAAVKQLCGATPTKLRERRDVRILKF